MKRWLRRNAQQFISWILKDAVVEDILSTEIKRETLYADVLLLVVLYGQRMLLHIEFQSTIDKTMAERLLEYNVQLSKEHGNLPVYSCVIYLCKADSAPQSPLIRRLPNGKEVLRFNFLNIELGKLSAAALLNEGLDGLLPLVLFTQEGKQVLDEVLARLQKAQDKELAALTFTLAGLIFQNETDRETIMRRFKMLEDMMKESWTYQYIVNKGLAEGLEKGLAEGREEERQEWLRTQRKALIDVVQMRFPALVADATERADQVEDPHVLQDILLKVALAQNSEEAKELLLELQ
jgi:predicted transposase/invertase (TIGR01784 family)